MHGHPEMPTSPLLTQAYDQSLSLPGFHAEPLLPLLHELASVSSPRDSYVSWRHAAFLKEGEMYCC